MKGNDKFGFRLGTKPAPAARLYESGATQADMIAATGTAQYNMLKDAQWPRPRANASAPEK